MTFLDLTNELKTQSIFFLLSQFALGVPLIFGKQNERI